MWRALETEPRRILNGHEEGNLGHKPRRSLRAAAPALDPTAHSVVTHRRCQSRAAGHPAPRLVYSKASALRLAPEWSVVAGSATFLVIPLLRWSVRLPAP